MRRFREPVNKRRDSPGYAKAGWEGGIQSRRPGKGAKLSRTRVVFAADGPAIGPARRDHRPAYVFSIGYQRSMSPV